jgi:hypothetical protein
VAPRAVWREPERRVNIPAAFGAEVIGFNPPLFL